MSEANRSPETTGHIPVLLKETTAALCADAPSVVVDCTAGRGGHAEALAQDLPESATIVLGDLDAENLEYATKRVSAATQASVLPLHCSFARIPRELNEKGLHADVVLADLGFASNQMDDPARGFSMMKDGPLDMRLDPSSSVTAEYLLATAQEAELARIIREYGEDPYAKGIARFLVRKREEKPIKTTTELARLVREAYGPRARSSRLHPATRTFQALRISVNDELGALDGILRQVEAGARAAVNGRPTWLSLGSKVAFITFHSLEDRMVKQTFVELERGLQGHRLARKPIVASEREIAVNSRARSAKLRVAKVGTRQD